MSRSSSRGGRPVGIPREGGYGTGVRTKVVRVPEEIAGNIKQILSSFDQIRLLVDAWDDAIVEAAAKSSVGKASPRYDRAIELLAELRSYLGD